jgi:hypothetical protein
MKRLSIALPGILSTAILFGCGGQSSTSTTSGPAVEAGQLHTVSTLVDGVEVNSATYKVFSVTDNFGSLSDQTASQSQEAALPHVLVLTALNGDMIGTTTSSYSDGAPASPLLSPPTIQDIKSCYKELFATVKIVRPSLTSTAQITQKLTDLDVTVDEICTQIPSSGLSMLEYVTLFDKVATYWPGITDIDGKFAIFFMNIQVRPSTFQKALFAKGYTWDQFLSRISSRNDGLAEFYRFYEESDLGISDTIDAYMKTKPQGTLAAKASNQLRFIASWLSNNLISSAAAKSQFDDLIKNANTGLNVIGQYWDMAKVAWEVVKNSAGSAKIDSSKPQTYLISKLDPNTINYYGAKESSTKVVSFVGKTYAFGLWENYRVDMQAVCDYDARHATIAGRWMPNIGIKTPRVDAGWSWGRGYKVDGEARASNAVNRGTPTDPIPSIDITMELTATAFSTVRKTYSFTCRGDTGASIK